MKRITAALAQERSKTGGSWTQKSMGTDHVVAHVVHHVKRIAEEGVIHEGVAPHHRAHHADVSVHFFEASTVLIYPWTDGSTDDVSHVSQTTHP